MSNNDLQKRNPIRNMQMALNTACAMGTAAMMSTMFAYAVTLLPTQFLRA